MDLRNGVWTSQTFVQDARDIVRHAQEIANITDDLTVRELAKQILSIAQRLERDLQRN